MLANGWERTKYVPYHVADRSRRTYLKSIGQYDYYEKYGAYEEQSRSSHTHETTDPEFSDLNM